MLTYDNLAGGAGTVGNLTGVSEYNSSGTLVATVTYGYDAGLPTPPRLYRLTGDVRTGTNPYLQQNYTYDLAGNRTKLAVTNGPTYNYTYNSADILTGGSISTTSDLDGNLTSISGGGVAMQNLTWDTLGNATAINNAYCSSTFGYDAFGRRIWAQVNGVKTFFIYDGDMLLGELRASDNGVNVVNTWGAAGLISEHVVSGNRSLWYHYGPQGETRQLTDSAGLIADTYTYGAYGVPVIGGSTGTDPNPFRYGGQVGYYTGANLNNFMNLIRCGTRWYDPDIGRWLSRDPIGYAGGPNLFEYCGGDPVGYIDPSGLQMMTGGAPGADLILPRGGPELVMERLRPVGAGLAESVRQLLVTFGLRRGRTPSERSFAFMFGMTVLPMAGVGELGAARGAEACAGQFSIRNWTGYPGREPPKGPFRLLQGAEYDAARTAADAENKALHAARPEWAGLHIHEIHPVKFGGSPTDIANKIAVSPEAHVQFNRFWDTIRRNAQGR